MAGIVSATMFRNTVKERRIVTPGKHQESVTYQNFHALLLSFTLVLGYSYNIIQTKRNLLNNNTNSVHRYAIDKLLNNFLSGSYKKCTRVVFENIGRSHDENYYFIGFTNYREMFSQTT